MMIVLFRIRYRLTIMTIHEHDGIENSMKQFFGEEIRTVTYRCRLLLRPCQNLLQHPVTHLLS